MGTRSYIARQIGDDQYLTIYCQLNGYPEDTGATLVKHYDTSEKVNALLALGDLYYLREKLSPDPGRHDFIAPQPGVTLAYRRDGDCPGWEATIKTFEELYDAADWAGIEYIYIYDTNGQWLYLPTGNQEAVLRSLKEDLENDTVQYSEPPDLEEQEDGPSIEMRVIYERAKEAEYADDIKRMAGIPAGTVPTWEPSYMLGAG